MRRATAWRLLAIAALCASASPAAAAPRVAIAGVRNDPAGTVAASLAKAMCVRLDCAPAERVYDGRRVDFATARRNGIEAILFGTVSTRGGRRVLALALLRGSFTPERTWALPVDATGRVDGGAVSAELAALLEPPRAAAPVSPPAAAAAPAPAPGAARAEDAEPRPAVAAAVVERPPPRAPRAGPPRAAGTAPASRRPPVAAVELGVALARRDLSYSGAAAGATPLMEFSASAIASPSLRLELMPLAGAEAWYAGATLFGVYARSVGLETEAATAARTRHETTLAQLELGAGLRFRPLASSGTTLLVRASYRTLSVKVSPKGAIPGLPDAALAGPSAGIDVELPLASRLAALAGVGYTAWLQAKDLVGGGYFPDGSAWGLDASAGLAVRVTGPFSVRVLGEYGRISYRLSGKSTYRATGATDVYLGGRFAVRGTF